MVYETEKLNEFATLLKRYASKDGVSFTSNKHVGLIRESFAHRKIPACFEPSLIFVGQGQKSCYVGDHVYKYSAGNLLVVFLPTPVETEIIGATTEYPFLAAGIRVDLVRFTNMLLKIENADSDAMKPISASSSSIFTMPLHDLLLDAVIRLLNTVENPRDAAILSDSIIDEIYYRILVDDKGGDFRFLLQQRGEIRRISKAIEYIHHNLDKQISIEGLAEMVHMSRTTFYESFRNMMYMSPLQYVKAMKLHKAKTLLSEGNRVNETGYLVGYNSPSQFSREFKHYFGYAPSETPVLITG